MHTNLNGVINGLNTYVPSFQSRSSDEASAIVITGSKQGITNPPGNPAYNASKAAVKALAEHLGFDLKDTQTSVHLLVPGWTFTGLVSRPSFFSSSNSAYHDNLVWQCPRHPEAETGWCVVWRPGCRVHAQEDGGWQVLHHLS
jgi:NAD(P)-dependent dehydrogenase (short-subunit alcohol dehydrogenase family)